MMYLIFSMLRTKYVALQSVRLPRLCAKCAGSALIVQSRSQSERLNILCW